MTETLVYVQLLDEGTTVFRPTRAEPLEGDRFRLLATPDYSPEHETWEFLPGTVVNCTWRTLSDGALRLVAVSDDQHRQRLSQLRALWAREHAGPRPGVTRTDLDQFESQHRVQLPEDMKEYFMTVDGMNGSGDRHDIRFLPLSEVTLEYRVYGPGDKATYLQFADYLVASHIYVIALDAGRHHVTQLDGVTNPTVADSFRHFIEIYFDRPSDLFWPGALRAEVSVVAEQIPWWTRCWTRLSSTFKRPE